MMKILQSDSTDISTLLVLFYLKVCILELLISKSNWTDGAQLYSGSNWASNFTILIARANFGIDTI